MVDFHDEWTLGKLSGRFYNESVNAPVFLFPPPRVRCIYG